MGQSQRYQAAVDGQLSRGKSLGHPEKTFGKWRPEPEHGDLTFFPEGSWGCLPEVFVKSPFGDSFFLGDAMTAATPARVSITARSVQSSAFIR